MLGLCFENEADAFASGMARVRDEEAHMLTQMMNIHMDQQILFSARTGLWGFDVVDAKKSLSASCVVECC